MGSGVHWKGEYKRESSGSTPWEGAREETANVTDVFITRPALKVTLTSMLQRRKAPDGSIGVMKRLTATENGGQRIVGKERVGKKRIEMGKRRMDQTK